MLFLKRMWCWLFGHSQMIRVEIWMYDNAYSERTVSCRRCGDPIYIQH